MTARQQVGWYDGSRVHQMDVRPVGEVPRHLAHTAGWVPATVGDEPVPEGWAFYTADFSVNADDPEHRGWLTLIRASEGRKAWHALSDTEKEATALFVSGAGLTFSEALADAIRACVDAPLPPSLQAEAEAGKSINTGA